MAYSISKMRGKLLLAVFMLLLVVAKPALIYFPGLQVNPYTIYYLQVACDRL